MMTGADETDLDAVNPEIVHWYPPRRRSALADEGRPRSVARPRAATGLTLLGAVAVGSLVVGAVAIGALAIGRLAIGRARIQGLRIGRLIVEDLEVEPGARRWFGR
jgi:hypothetical protein